MKKIVIIFSLTLSLFASIENEVEKERFSYEKGVLTDTFTELKWQDNSDAKSIQKNWNDATNYCNNLSLNNISNWRIPSSIELEYAYQIKSKFKNLAQGFYLSNSSRRHYSKEVYVTNFINGSTYGEHKGANCQVRCVKGNIFKSTKKLNNYINKTRKNKIFTKYDKIYIKEYNKVKKLNTLKAYENFIKEYPRATNVVDAKRNISNLYNSLYKSKYSTAKNKDSIKSYKNFIKQYSKAPQVKEAQQKIYTLAYNKVNKTNSIKSYSNFIKNYKYAPQKKKAQNKIYKLAYINANSMNSIQSYIKFINKYHNATQKQKAIQNIYNLTKKENNIVGYEWFIRNFRNTPQVKDAIKDIHKLAYNKAKQINKISSYNTFIYAYPFSSQVRDANDKAYNLESRKYKKLKKDDEKKARLLAVRIKKMTVSMKRKSNKDGYIIVKDRMIKLLTEQYEETDASLRYYESKEFTDFTETFENVMSSISSKLSNIEKYSSEILNTSKQGFADSKADREMTKYKNEEHHKWDKRMHLMEKGYN